MKKSNLRFAFLIMTLPFFLLSCGGGDNESAIAKQITLTVSNNSIVLPNSLSDIYGQTCISGGIGGPRVRLRVSLKWAGENFLLPIVFRISATDSRIDGEIKGTVSPGDEVNESLASFFGVTATDYIPPGNATYTTTDCFLDYGSLPKPRVELKGAAQLEIPVIISLFGVVRDVDGNDTPFIKEVQTSLLYVAGSIPAN